MNVALLIEFEHRAYLYRETLPASQWDEETWDAVTWWMIAKAALTSVMRPADGSLEEWVVKIFGKAMPSCIQLAEALVKGDCYPMPWFPLAEQIAFQF